jgi:hypothetical protein
VAVALLLLWHAGDVPEALDRLLTVVLHDITATSAPEPRVQARGWCDDASHESAILWAADGSGAGVRIDLELPTAEALAHLADQVQEWLIEEFGRTLQPTDWPPCDDHPTSHPLTATAVQGMAVWKCPKDGTTAKPIGTL